MKLIAGLGNPGKKYEKTRHNVGFMILDALHRSLEAYAVSPWQFSKEFNAYTAGCTVGSEKIILIKPTTFMNDSGVSVGAIAHFYKIPPPSIMIVHDDKDIPLGEIKIQKNRGAAGHHGVESIFSHIGTEDCMRVRVGVGSKKQKNTTGEFVLSKFGLFDRSTLNASIQAAINEIKQLIGATA